MIRYLQDRIVSVTVEAQTNPCMWPVVAALKSTLTRVISVRKAK